MNLLGPSKRLITLVNDRNINRRGAMGYEYILMDEVFRCLRGKAEVVEGEFEGR